MSQTMLSEEFITSIKQAFDGVDKDGDGCLTSQEMLEAFRSMGQFITSDELTGLLQEVDTDDNGYIDFHEFLTASARRMKTSGSDKEISNVFRAFDSNRNGYLTANEIEQAMNKLGEHLTTEEVDEMVRMADQSGNNKISETEFISIINSAGRADQG